MAGDPGFGVRLRGLLDGRRLDAGVVCRRADVDGSELSEVFRGAAPGPDLLRRLAPALGLRTADLFVIAGVALPDDLAPSGGRLRTGLPRVVRHAVALPREQLDVVRRFAASLPREDRTPPAPGPPYERYPAGPGAVLMRMVRNRNLGRTATAQTFLLVTGRYWSAATYGMVGAGRVELTPELLIDFSAVLGVPAGDLAALSGVTLPDGLAAPDPAATGVAELIWDVRRLTTGQLEQVADLAASLRR